MTMLAIFSTLVCAQPTQITFNVGAPPGGPTDVLARNVAAYLDSPDTTVVVLNKPGANGTVAMRSSLEQQNLNLVVASSSSFVFNRVMFDNLDIQPLQEFEVVGPMIQTTFAVITSKNSKYKSVTDFKKSSVINCGVPNQASMLAAQMMFKQLNVQGNIIMYKGSNQMIQDIFSESLECAFDIYALYLPLHTAGQLKLIAVADTNKIDNIPTLKSSGVDIVMHSWFGVGMPKKFQGTDKYEQVKNKLYLIHNDKEFIERVKPLGFQVAKPDRLFAKKLQNDFEYWDATRAALRIEKLK